MKVVAALLVSIGVALLAGCGSDVTRGTGEGPGSGGAAGSGGPGGGAGAASVCTLGCDARSNCLAISHEECVSGCSQLMPQCELAYTDLLDCNVDEGATACGFSYQCTAFSLPLLDCAGGNQGNTAACTHSSQTGADCACSIEYNSGHMLEFHCDPSGQGCECIVDSKVIGHCDTEDFAFCDSFGSCCVQLAATVGVGL
jgi:hypothetical protein